MKKRIILLVIVIISICVFSLAGYSIYITWLEKQHSYDLSEMPEGYISQHDPTDSLYVKTIDGEIVISESIYFYDNTYINAVSTLSGSIHMPSDVFYVLDYGIYEQKENSLYFLDAEGRLTEYKVLNQYLLCYDEFYSGDVPKKDVFNSIHIRTSEDGTKQTITFNEDGTYVITQDTHTKTGTYIRNGYEIFCTNDNKEDTNIKFVVYNGKLTQTYFENDSADADWIKYKTLIYMRDELQIISSAFESSRVNKYINDYESEHPISTN